MKKEYRKQKKYKRKKIKKKQDGMHPYEEDVIGVGKLKKKTNIKKNK